MQGDDLRFEPLALEPTRWAFGEYRFTRVEGAVLAEVRGENGLVGSTLIVPGYPPFYLGEYDVFAWGLGSRRREKIATILDATADVKVAA
jgi:hypothetical protein